MLITKEVELKKELTNREAYWADEYTQQLGYALYNLIRPYKTGFKITEKGEMEKDYLEDNKQWIEYMVRYQGGDEDALQDVYLMLLESEHKFDNIKVNFRSWAYKYIFGTVQRSFQRRNLIHVPTNVNKWERFAEEAKNLVTINESDDEVYEQLATEEPSPEEKLLEKDKKDYIMSKIRELSQREQTIIIGRFYDNRTLEDIGKELNICRERVRQLEKPILAKLKNIINLKEIQ